MCNEIYFTEWPSFQYYSIFTEALGIEIMLNKIITDKTSWKCGQMFLFKLSSLKENLEDTHRNN